MKIAPQRSMVIAIFEDKETYNKLLPAELPFAAKKTGTFVSYADRDDAYGTVIEYKTTDLYHKSTKSRTWDEVVIMMKVCRAVNIDFEREALTYTSRRPPHFAAVVQTRW